MIPILKVLIFISLVSFTQAAHKKSSKLVKKVFTTNPNFSTVYSPTPGEYEAAWNSAAPIDHRNPNIWRVDKNSNIIMSRNYARNCPISFDVYTENSGKLRNKPQAKLNNFATPWAFIPQAELLMNIIEIGLIGYVTDEMGNPICWTPSKIHNDFMVTDEDSISEQWVQNAQSIPKNGLLGHIYIFGDMGIFIRKDIGARTIIGSINIGETVPFTCSDYVSNFVLRPIIVNDVSPDSDDEVEGKTDSSDNANNTDLDADALLRLEGLEDEDFSRILEELSKSSSKWVEVGPSPVSKKSAAKTPPASKTSTGKSSSGKTSGSLSVGSVDDSDSGAKKLVSGASGAKVAKTSTGSHKYKISSPYPKK